MQRTSPGLTLSRDIRSTLNPNVGNKEEKWNDFTLKPGEIIATGIPEA
jgi:hypothetical protein